MKDTAPTEPIVLPPGISLEHTELGVTIVNAQRDVGDVFSLLFLGVVVLLFAAAIGGKLADAMGSLIGIAAASPLWSWLLSGAARRAINTARIIATPSSLTIRSGPIPHRGSTSTWSGEQIGEVHTKSFKNVSSTRGATKALVTNTWSVWLRDGDGKEHCLLEQLDTDAQARFVVAAIRGALNGAP